MTKNLPLCALLSGALLLTACAVGPDFEKPSAQFGTTYRTKETKTSTVSSDSKNGAAQTFVKARDIPADWWTLFKSKPLNTLLKKALDKNPDLQASKAALLLAKENLATGQGALWPSISGTAGASQQEIAGSTNVFELYNTSVSVAYILDVWGGTRRSVEALDAEYDYQKAQLEAARLSLTGNIITSAFQEASIKQQIRSTKQILQTQKKTLALLEKQLTLGAINKTPVLSQKALIAKTEASIPLLEKSLGQNRHLLTILAGEAPNKEMDEAFLLDDLHLPEELPLSLPSSLVEQRPDIQAATSKLHAASAAIGIAIANRLPQVTLSADYGVSAATFASMFSPGTAAWNLTSGLVQPLFEGGARLHKQRAAEAAFQQATASYQSVVLNAFKNVADVLQALESDAKALNAQNKALESARESLELAKKQYYVGAISYLALLSSEQMVQEAQLELIAARTRRFTDTAALFQALGGGWWHAPLSTENSNNKPTTPLL